MSDSNGIVPTFDINGNGNNNGWGGSMGEWIIGLVALGMLASVEMLWDMTFHGF